MAFPMKFPMKIALPGFRRPQFTYLAFLIHVHSAEVSVLKTHLVFDYINAVSLFSHYILCLLIIK